MKKSKHYRENFRDCVDFDKVPAAGILKKVAEDFEKLSANVRDLGYLAHSGCPGLNSARFMQDGNRTNGMLRKSGSLIKLYKSSKNYLNGLKQLEKEIKDRRGRVEKMYHLLDTYRVCPDCDGEGGELLGPNYWEDCPNCSGQGMIEKNT